MAKNKVLVEPLANSIMAAHLSLDKIHQHFITLATPMHVEWDEFLPSNNKQKFILQHRRPPSQSTSVRAPIMMETLSLINLHISHDDLL